MAAKARGQRGDRSRPIQYTVRDVPPAVDSTLRRKARLDGKSLNGFLRDALIREAGLDSGADIVHHDLDDLAGRWEEDPDFDAAIEAQHAVDEDLWR
jgi:hypothetical protein